MFNIKFVFSIILIGLWDIKILDNNDKNIYIYIYRKVLLNLTMHVDIVLKIILFGLSK